MVELIAVMVILVCLTLLALPTLKTAKDKAREARCMEEIRDIEKSINNYAIDKGSFPNSLTDLGRGTLLDPWGHPYAYVNLSNGGGARTGFDLAQLNTDFDLYSTGSDGATALSIADSSSADDVVRGANGSFVGLADKY